MNIGDNVNSVREIIENKKKSLGISYDINIVAVTKTQPAESVKEAVKSGITIIGENRVQEAESKFRELEDLGFERHLIGHLQSNKAGKAAKLFDMVQSVDNKETALELDRRCAALGKVMTVLIEVNTSGEASKFGIEPPDTDRFTEWLENLACLKVKGLMTVGPDTTNLQEIRKSFRSLYLIREKIGPLRLPVLSMGMSHDYEIAIEEGSNMVRLGRVLFGERGQ